jgi:beta-xylosidase
MMLVARKNILPRLGFMIRLSAILFVAAPVQAADARKSPLHLPEMPLHDPWILAHGPSRTYYLYTSNLPRMSGVKGVGTMVYKSKDLRNWETPKVVFLVPPTAFARHGGWAPEVHEYKGRYYLFTTLHNEKKTLASPPAVPIRTYVRGSVVAVSDSPDGPFKMLDEKAPMPPANFMTLDGTLYVDRSGEPWMVYAHEWIQKLDGTMEAVPLKPDLSAAAGPPISLFKASDAPWLDATTRPNARPLTYTTDGPELYRTRDGHLLMLWSSYENGSYVQTVARSKSGGLAGPWEQLAPLVKGDSGHGMLFRTFGGRLMMVLHRPFKNARGKLYEMADRGDHLEVVKERIDLDGDAGQHPSSPPQ